MWKIGAGTKLKRVLVDRFNVIPAGVMIDGNDANERQFFRDPSGLISAGTRRACWLAN
jgi:ADP-glucose pyrophosphorylase